MDEDTSLISLMAKSLQVSAQLNFIKKIALWPNRRLDWGGNDCPAESKE